VLRLEINTGIVGGMPKDHVWNVVSGAIKTDGWPWFQIVFPVSRKCLKTHANSPIWSVHSVLGARLPSDSHHLNS